MAANKSRIRILSSSAGDKAVGQGQTGKRERKKFYFNW